MTNIQYEALRNKLIPEAERYANEKFNLRSGYKTPAGVKRPWDRAYFKRMNELAIASGLAEEGSV